MVKLPALTCYLPCLLLNSLHPVCLVIFFFKQKTAYEVRLSLVGSEMCIRDSLGLLGYLADIVFVRDGTVTGVMVNGQMTE